MAKSQKPSEGPMPSLSDNVEQPTETPAQPWTGYHSRVFPPRPKPSEQVVESVVEDTAASEDEAKAKAEAEAQAEAEAKK